MQPHTRQWRADLYGWRQPECAGGFNLAGIIGADVNHINLHKTFAIPHGGGGPGMGPICVAKHLAPYLPGNAVVKTGGNKAINGVSSAPFGSASILLISYGYIRMLGALGVTDATKYAAILNANYMKSRLEEYYQVLYTGKESPDIPESMSFTPTTRRKQQAHSLKNPPNKFGKRVTEKQSDVRSPK